jgi:hypothetical protein
MQLLPLLLTTMLMGIKAHVFRRWKCTSEGMSGPVSRHVSGFMPGPVLPSRNFCITKTLYPEKSASDHPSPINDGMQDGLCRCPKGQCQWRPQASDDPATPKSMKVDEAEQTKEGDDDGEEERFVMTPEI